eukprot:m.190823 g.190823  ORF g.190823 m.190823 type:complete len:388 (-) comp18575_c0_seq1:61-1224(-)
MSFTAKGGSSPSLQKAPVVSTTSSLVNHFPLREPLKTPAQFSKRHSPRASSVIADTPGTWAPRSRTMTPGSRIRSTPMVTERPFTNTAPVGVRMLDGGVERVAPPLPKGSAGGRFSSTVRFQEIRLPSMHGGFSRRSTRLKPIYSQRWVAIPPPQEIVSERTTAAPLMTTPLAQEWEDSSRNIRFPVTQRLPGYLLMGNRMTPKCRKDLEQEELLQSQHLGLHPAPELYFGRGFSSEQRAVRLRRLNVEPNNALVRAEPVQTGAPSRPITTAIPANEPIIEDTSEHSGTGDMQADDTSVPLAGDLHSARAEAPRLDMDHETTLMSTPVGSQHVPTGWEGTALDPSTSARSFKTENGADTAVDDSNAHAVPREDDSDVEKEDQADAAD